MGINERIQNDTVAALKAKDAILLATLRLVSAAIKNAEIEQRTKGASESKSASNNDLEILAVAAIKRQIKQTMDALEDFKRGGRSDLVQNAEAEIKILQSYLPAELGDGEIEKIIDEVLVGGDSGAVAGASGAVVNVGKIIGEVMKQIAGRADGARVRSLIEARLPKK